jgi:hypothetical protein
MPWYCLLEMVPPRSREFVDTIPTVPSEHLNTIKYASHPRPTNTRPSTATSFIPIPKHRRRQNQRPPTRPSDRLLQLPWWPSPSICNLSASRKVCAALERANVRQNHKRRMACIDPSKLSSSSSPDRQRPNNPFFLHPLTRSLNPLTPEELPAPMFLFCHPEARNRATSRIDQLGPDS